jgi:UDP-N-acetylmuramoyl-L-alanyl-D-glutamate--2,6-diaminopimelate ligase
MAVPGTRAHGARFAGQSAGHSVLTDEEGLGVLADGVLAGDRPRGRRLPAVARSLSPRRSTAIPSRDMTVIGVTGTSGKTTTTYMMERALLGHVATSVSSAPPGRRIDGRKIPTSLTTPEAPTLQALFARMRDEGVTHVVMEVSSHALVLGRVRGVDFDVAGFTNLSQDHLDFHPTMEDYFDAKSLLFTEPQDPTAELPVSVVCVDDGWGRRLAERTGDDTVTVSTGGEAATWQVSDVAVHPDGTQHITVDRAEGAVDFDLSIPGAFNVANATLALATLVAAGEDASIAAELAEVSVPGRMEKISGSSPQTAVDFLALVDYAHKPGAVTAVLDTLNGQLDRAAAGRGGTSRGRLGVVLGAGGNRDHEKRPKMGAAAAAVADLVIVTDDNPRDEDPATIRAAVLAGATDAAARRTDGVTPGIREIGDRAEAIRAAVAWARSGDVIVVAGKGHESGQIIGDTVVDFDDRVELADALSDLPEHKESEA